MEIADRPDVNNEVDVLCNTHTESSMGVWSTAGSVRWWIRGNNPCRKRGYTQSKFQWETD